MGCGGRGWGRNPFGYGWGGGGIFPPPRENRNGEYVNDQTQEYSLIKEEIRKLYAAGKISSTVYHESIDKLKLGRFNLDDLWELRQSIESKGVNSPSPQVSTVNNNIPQTLHNKKVELVKAKEDTLLILQNLQHTISELRKKMDKEEELAKESIKIDELVARSHIERRHEIAVQVAGLEVKVKEVQKDLVHLEELELKLEAKIAEHTVSKQSERLAKLEDMINRL